MKRFLIFALVLLFVSCEQVTTVQVPDTKYYVKNSAWQNVDIDVISASRGASLSEAIEIVEEYNAVTNDDQLFIDTTDVPVEEAPLATIYIVNEGDYVLLAEYVDVVRSEYISRRVAYQLQAMNLGGILFVDKVPPVPVIPEVEPLPDYERYAIYLLNAEGIIQYEEHCNLTCPAGTNIEEYFARRVYMVNLEAINRGHGAYVISGRLYIQPN